jgi:hypothetical protein
MTRLLCTGLLLGGLLAGCGTAPDASTSDAVIVHIQRHDATISVRATPTGIVYDVRGEDSAMRGMSDAEFQAHHPDLYRFYRQSTAGTLDATLYLPETQ